MASSRRGSSALAPVLLLLAVVGARAHGSVASPRPRNSEPPSLGSIPYGVVLYPVSSGRVAMETHNQHLCPPGGGFQTETYPQGTCVANPATQQRPSYIFSASRPAATGPLVDCTPHNNCSATAVVGPETGAEGAWEAEAGGDGPIVWLSVYPPNSKCSGGPSLTYKMRANACTQLPVDGYTYWTGGCAGFACQWFSQGCAAGCAECTGDWARNHCGSPAAPSLPDRYRTFNIHGADPHGGPGDWTAFHPWRSPGAAPVLDACGVAGGAPRDNTPPGGHPPPAHTWGDRGSGLPPLAAPPAPTWAAGEVVELAWGIAANHGGGYAYRLCPRPPPGAGPVTEDCFQQRHLAFAGDTQTLILGNGTKVEIPAQVVTEGTHPRGSAWMRNPIPACILDDKQGDVCQGPQFAPPAGCDATCWGTSDNYTISNSLPLIVDRVALPADLPPGEYILGWRWDCEGTSQIWASCSDVVVVVAAAPQQGPRGRLDEADAGARLRRGRKHSPGFPAVTAMTAKSDEERDVRQRAGGQTAGGRSAAPVETIAVV